MNFGLLCVCDLAGFCALSNTLPLPWHVETEVALAPGDNGMNAAFGEEVHCVAAEPHAAFVRLGIMDGGREVAFEVAVLGRLRGGFRIFQLRSVLGTRIELACLFVHVSFGYVDNLWPNPRQVRTYHSALCSIAKGLLRWRSH